MGTIQNFKQYAFKVFTIFESKSMFGMVEKQREGSRWMKFGIDYKNTLVWQEKKEVKENRREKNMRSPLFFIISKLGKKLFSTHFNIKLSCYLYF